MIRTRENNPTMIGKHVRTKLTIIDKHSCCVEFFLDKEIYKDKEFTLVINHYYGKYEQKLYRYREEVDYPDRCEYKMTGAIFELEGIDKRNIDNSDLYNRYYEYGSHILFYNNLRTKFYLYSGTDENNKEELLKTGYVESPNGRLEIDLFEYSTDFKIKND